MARLDKNDPLPFALLALTGRVADVLLDQLLPMFDEHGRQVAPVADWSMAVDDPARQMELRMVLSSAIAELPADYRVVELLRDVDGL